MDITTIRGRVIAILEGYTACNGATGGVPRNVADMDLPHFIVLADRELRQWTASDLIQESRTFRLLLLVKPWVQGVDLEAEELCEPYFISVPNVFDARPSLQLDDNTTPLAHVQSVLQSENSGVIGIQLAGVSYSGSEWKLDVTTLMRKQRGL